MASEDMIEHNEHSQFETYTPPGVSMYLSDPSAENSENKRVIDSYSSVTRYARAYSEYGSLEDMLPGQSGRVEYNRDTFEFFRPGQVIPKKYPDVIKKIDDIYSGVAIVRNMIDLMSDFAMEGIEVVHPVPYIEKFYKEWFRKVKGPDRSERFLSGIYRHGMVVVRKYHGTLNRKQRKNLEEYGLAASDVELNKIDFSKYNIPLKYVFYNPACFEHKNYHDINATPEYVIKVPKNMFSNEYGNSGLSQLEEKSIDPTKLYVAYYKKDDWKTRPTPFLCPIIKHANMLEQLTLADQTALDGAISKIRVFKLGSIQNPEFPIYPSPTMAEKLDSILRSSTSGGTVDIVWGPDLEIVETNSDIHNFLGQEKYVPHITQIYEGLGIPSSFVGSGSGATNNYISLKILIRRLVSGRDRLIEFWNTQLKEVQLAMGFAECAKLEFNNLDLGDEESERNLIIQLLDRNIVSEETVQKILGYDPRMESKRISREHKEREAGRRQDKAGQYHNGEKEFTLQKVALERGWYAPEHVGLEKEEGSEEEKSPNDQRMQAEKEKQATNPAQKDNGSSGGPGGRPRGAKDKTKRKTPAFSPKIKAALDIWAEDAQNKIDAILKTAILHAYSKKSYRELTSEECSNFELLKFGVLSNIKPLSDIKEDIITSSLSKSMKLELKEIYDELYKQTLEALGKKISLSGLRSVQRKAYIEWLELNEEDEV